MVLAAPRAAVALDRQAVRQSSVSATWRAASPPRALVIDEEATFGSVFGRTSASVKRMRADWRYSATSMCISMARASRSI